MINFRFHIISIVAIFLALGVGIVMGSTVIDRAIVDSLRTQINTAEKNSVNRKVENDRLTDELKSLNQQDTVLASHTVRNYLDNQSVYIVALGDIPDDVSTEMVELGSISGAQIDSMFTFKDDFVTKDKTKLFQQLMSAAKVDGGSIDPSQRLHTVLSFFENSLNVLRDNNDDVLNQGVDYGAFFELLKSKSVFGESNAFVNPKEKQNVSFIVLIDRSKLEDKNYVDFAASLVNNFPVTFGLVEDNATAKPSRNDAISKLKIDVPDLALVDDAELPSGRAALIIAHSRNIAGSKDIYGISSGASAKAPFIE